MTTVHQLHRPLVRALVEAVTEHASPSAEVDDEAVSAVFATATWSTLAEPGDAVAGAIVGAIGADRSLSMLIEGCAPGVWLTALQEVGDESVLSVGDLSSALERWMPPDCPPERSSLPCAQLFTAGLAS